MINEQNWTLEFIFGKIVYKYARIVHTVLGQVDMSINLHWPNVAFVIVDVAAIIFRCVSRSWKWMRTIHLLRKCVSESSIVRWPLGEQICLRICFIVGKIADWIQFRKIWKKATVNICMQYNNMQSITCMPKSYQINHLKDGTVGMGRTLYTNQHTHTNIHSAQLSEVHFFLFPLEENTSIDFSSAFAWMEEHFANFIPQVNYTIRNSKELEAIFFYTFCIAQSRRISRSFCACEHNNDLHVYSVAHAHAHACRIQQKLAMSSLHTYRRLAWAWLNASFEQQKIMIYLH